MSDQIVFQEPIEEYPVYVSFQSADTRIGIIKRNNQKKFAYFPEKLVELKESDLEAILSKVRKLNAPRLTARNAELEAEKCVLEDQLREATNFLIDKNLHIDSLYEEGYKLQQRIAELEAENDQLTAHDATERQDDKSSNRVATPIDVALRKRIAELEKALNIDTDLTIAGLRKELRDATARIAELETDNAEFRQLIRDWSIVLEQNNGFWLWQVESVRQAMLEINKERER